MAKCKLLAAVAVAMVWSAFAGRTVENFNDGWWFAKGDRQFESDDAKGFRAVTLPHDWAIEGPFTPRRGGDSGSLPWKGRAVYRKKLVVKELPKGRVFLEFDGVMARAKVYVGRHAVGHGDYGYLGFDCELTPYLYVGTNTIEVHVDTEDHASRWYPGAGIIRDVRLVTMDKVHFIGDGLRIETKDVLTGKAEVKVDGEIVSRLSTDVRARVTAVLRDPKGKVVGTADEQVALEAGAVEDFDFDIKVPRPQLWKLERNAKLYALELTLKGEGFDDRIVRRIGLREFRFDRDNGFILNGERVQLNGVNLHSDLGPLGMAFDANAMRRQLEIMLDMGVNALRTSHNPPAPQVLDICDELGIFVWDECFDKWNETCGRGSIPLEEFVPVQLRKLVRRDRTHPCVFVWSIGNEISSGKAMPPGQESWAVGAAWGTSAERSATFRVAVREEDKTRPVAIGSCFGDAIDRGDHLPLDVVGWNYGDTYVKSHQCNPKLPVLGSETASAFSEFGYYADELPTNKADYAYADEAIDSYDLNSSKWADIPDREFFRMERDRFCAGEFVWTGIDYLGEPSPYWTLQHTNFLSRSSYFGICDICALPKDRFYLYRSHWNKDDFTLHIVPGHWNFPKKIGKTMPVFVYTSADEAELFVNGKSQGRRRKDKTAGVLAKDWTNAKEYYSILPRYRLMWMEVPYEVGEVKAVAYDREGQVLGIEVLRTASEPVRVQLTPERAYGDFRVVVVTLADKDGNFVPGDNRRVSFVAEGCEILAVGNGNPRGMDGFKDVASHPLHNGRAAVYLRMKDGVKSTLTASASGLESAVLEVCER